MVVRRVRKAARSHPCADCPVEIPKGDDYIEDSVMERAGAGRPLFRRDTVRWHLACTPTRDQVIAEDRPARPVVDTPVPARLRTGAIAELARDLLELHQQEALSLDTWVAAREVVEAYTGPIEENGV